MSLAPSLLPAIRESVAPPVHAVPAIAPTTDHSPEAGAEEKRWLRMLVPPFLVSSALFAAAINTGVLWLIGPAMATGPGLIIIGFIYLALTSESNDTG